ncbi:MAG: rhomboid family intramembrane serine protease [Proteobacteria bacterium]|nr:rhomboid family intramembrane serine protease [Pseudomonadota bacterium]
MDLQKRSKYCHRCQASLDTDARICPVCHEKQLMAFEQATADIVRALFPRVYPATRIIFFLLIAYFILFSADIVLHPEYGLKEALLAPPTELSYRWGAHLRGQFVWWRLITANFYHFGIIHIVFNTVALKYVSPYVERTYGSAQTFAAFVILGTLSMACSNILGDNGIVGGASGSLMAFIGMAAVAAHREHTALSLEIRNSMIRWALFTIAFGLIISLSGSLGIDNISHVSGLLLGILAGLILPKQAMTGFDRLWKIRLSRSTLPVAVALTVTAFVFMTFAGQSQKHQSECIADIQHKNYAAATTACEQAYREDPSLPISYHNYILINAINGDHDRARHLCAEGKRRFRNQKEPLSFDKLCQDLERTRH